VCVCECVCEFVHSLPMVVSFCLTIFLLFTTHKDTTRHCCASTGCLQLHQRSVGSGGVLRFLAPPSHCDPGALSGASPALPPSSAATSPTMPTMAGWCMLGHSTRTLELMSTPPHPTPPPPPLSSERFSGHGNNVELY